VTTQALPRILALAPRGFEGLDVVAAACRASALGILDLVADPTADVDSLSAGLARLTGRPFGVRLAAEDLECQSWLSGDGERLAVVWVVLGDGATSGLGEQLESVKRSGRTVLAEVTTCEAMRRAIEQGFSSLILTADGCEEERGSEKWRDLLQVALAEGALSFWLRGGIGPANAAACINAGAAGVVLDSALSLAREVPSGARSITSGRDAAVAAQLARKYVTVGGIIQATELAIDEGIAAATASAPRFAAETLASANGKQAHAQPSDVAIVGMAAIFPGATSAGSFWSNTLRGTDSIIEVPPDRWDWRLYYDPDPKAPDKIVSKWGGFVPDVVFDPLRYGMPPSSLPSIEPAQMLALEVVRAALEDAGYVERPFPRERTGVVLGMGGGAAQLAMGYAFRSYLPMLDTIVPEAGKKAIEACKGLLPEWTEDSFPGFLLNVTAGRIANRLNLGGANYTVDAACGSSLAAANLAVRELETGSADVVILGGVDTVQNPFTYLAFSKTQAFSHRGRCRPFDVGADGIVISEGAGAVVLKRLADAERDGDRIYAVIKGVGASSDGRVRGLTAPVVDGQLRALARAYAKSAVSPASVGYVEAHGTGTALGDVVEVEALGKVFREAGATKGQCVVGSVKSLIGHTKCAAGLAGLINASLALYHKIYPPTIGIEKPNPKLDLHDGPFRLCTQAQPWLHADANCPRRAGVSAFGFGGTNFHAVLEEYDRNLGAKPEATFPDWPLELFVWQAPEPSQIIPQIDGLAAALESGAKPNLGDLSHTLIQAREELAAQLDLGNLATLTILAGTHAELSDNLRQAAKAIRDGRTLVDDPRGICFSAKPAWSGAPVAFLFPGQGSQTPGMLQELAVIFPEVREAFDEFDREIAQRRGRLVGPLVFAAPAFDAAGREQARVALMETDVAQPAVGAACVGLLRFVTKLGLKPRMMAGHSYGELVALHAAGVLDAPALAALSLERGRLMREASGSVSGSMAALLTGPAEVEKLASEVPDVQVANWNGPRQTVIAGPTTSVAQAVELAAGRGIAARILPVSRAFHTSLVASAREPLSRLAQSLLKDVSDCPVYSNLDAQPHPTDPAAIARRLGDHLAQPVRFAEMIETMYRDGARVFVEVGPGSVLTTLIDSNLAESPHLAVSFDSAGSSGLRSCLRAIARLVTAGVSIRLERLTRGRGRRVLNLQRLPQAEGAENWTASTWIVNGSRARPVAGSERRRLGMVLDSTLPTGETAEAARSQAQSKPERAPVTTPPPPAPTRATAPAQPVSVHPTVRAQSAPVRSPGSPRRAEPSRSLTSTKLRPSDSPTSPNAMPACSQIARPANASRPLVSSGSKMAAAGSGEHSNGDPNPAGNDPHGVNGKLDSQANMKPFTPPPSNTERVLESFQETMKAFLEVQRSTMLAYLTGRVPAGASGMTPAGTMEREQIEMRGLDPDRLAAPAGEPDFPDGAGPYREPGAFPPTAEPAESIMPHAASFNAPSNGHARRPAQALDRASGPDGRPRGASGAHAPLETPAPTAAEPLSAASEPSAVAMSAASDATTAPAVDLAPARGPAASGNDRLQRAEITTRLLEIVRDRTGYPIETLGLDLDMEADLGIDSIKRVEILGKLRDDFPTLKGLSESADVMEALARARTLGMIADQMVSLAEAAAPAAAPSESSSIPTASAKHESNGVVHLNTLRRLVETVEAPLPRRRANLMKGGSVVITDDGRGIAELLAARLARAGIRTERIGGPAGAVDWTSPSDIEAAVANLRSRGAVAGIAHLLPLAQWPATTKGQEDWPTRVGREVKGLFLLAKATAADLENAARAGGACLIAATVLGGRFASGGSTNADFFPGHGGIAGLVKTLAREWSAVRSRVVDFSANDSNEWIAERLAGEMFVGDGWPEIGYERGRRVRLRTVESALQHSKATLELNPGDPVLISGGARGITALVAAELAKTWRPSLLIVGTTPLPSEPESPDTASLRGESEIKTVLHARLRGAGRAAGPAEIETAYQALRRLREVRENLAILRNLGATVEYAQVDVCDPRALGTVLEGWRSRYGEFAGLIHGAGLIKDKLIRHKTVESFDRVLGTKLDGALNLVRLVVPDALKFAVLFSSIAGRFGNVGQSDYAAANEILNKLALWLDRRWPCRVVSAIWGPWSGVGMVSQLESHLGRRGLGMIAPEVGRSLLIDELRYGKKGDVEVIYTGELGTLEQPIVCEAAPEPVGAVS
jgi:acyl transferase domain-containing protein